MLDTNPRQSLIIHILYQSKLDSDWLRNKPHGIETSCSRPYKCKMYMYMSSTISLRERRRDYYLNDCGCNHLVGRQGSVRTLSFTSSAAAYARVSRGLRQSALLCDPTLRRGVGYRYRYRYSGCYKLLHKQANFSCVLYAGQEGRLRCLGWEEEEEDCLEGMQGEVYEMLNLLMEDRCRRLQVSKIRESSEIPTAPSSAGAHSGIGRIRKEKTYFTDQTVAQELAGKDTSTSRAGGSSRAERSLFGKLEGLSWKEALGGHGASTSRTFESSRVEQSLLGRTEGLLCSRNERVQKSPSTLQGSSRAEKCLFGKEEAFLCNRKETVHGGPGKAGSGSLLNDLSEARWVSTAESQKQEETATRVTGKSVAEICWNDLRSDQRWVSSLESLKQEERVQKTTDQKGPDASLNDTSSKLRQVCATKSLKQEEAIQKCIGDTGSDVPSNDLRSDVRWASTIEASKEEKILKGMKEVSSETSYADLTSNVKWVSAEESTIEETVQETVKKPVSEVSLKGLSSNMGRISMVESQNEEETCSLEKQESAQIGLSAVEESVEQLEETVQKGSRTLVPAVPCDPLRKNTGSVSVTQLEKLETFEKTTEVSSLRRKDGLVRNNGRDSSAQLEEEKDIAEEGGKPVSEVLASQPAGIRTSQKLFLGPANKLGSSEVLKSATELEKKESCLDYETSSSTSQKKFEALLYKPACSEASGAAAEELEKSKSTAGYETGNKTSQKSFKDPYYKMSGNDCLGSTAFEKKKSTADYEAGNKTSQKLFKDSSSKLASDAVLGSATELEKNKSAAGYKTGNKTSQKLFKDPSYKLASNEVLASATGLVTKKSIANVETKTASGKLVPGRLSNESEGSLGMVSAKGTENLSSAARTFEESPIGIPISPESSKDFVSKGPSDEVWAVAGWSSRDEFEELQSSGTEIAEMAIKTLDYGEPLGKLPKNGDWNSSADLKEQKPATLKSTGKAIVKRPSRWLWSSFLEFCRKGWGSHAESENCTLESHSGRTSTESPGSEDWFSVPELEDQECSPKEKSNREREKSLVKKQGHDLISDARLNPITDLKETDSTQQGKSHKTARKCSLDELPLPRRRVLRTGYEEYESVERENGKGIETIADSKKTESMQQGNALKAAKKRASEGSLDELLLPRGHIPGRACEEHDQLERRRGKAALENSAELEEHTDMERLIESSKTKEEKNESMSTMFKRNKQVTKETFALWEEALLLENEQRREDEKFMREALLEARLAADAWEVPVGAVLVQHGKIIARAHNLVEENRDATAHAELLCIRDASNQLRTWRLADTTLYVTLEPCAMCAGAILQARVGTVVWGSPNNLLGADGSWISLFPRTEEKFTGPNEEPFTAGPIHPFHPNIKVRRGVLASECSDVMKQFFKLRRKRDKKTESSCFPFASYPNKLYTKVHEIFGIMFCL